MAQRQRAGLITPRTLDRNGLSVSSSNRTGASRHLEHPSRTPKTIKHIPVWRRGSALLKLRLLHLYHLWYDLRMVMDYTPEDVGSKPTAGNISIWLLYRSSTSCIDIYTFFTGMAQRQRAGLITPRSLDRNGLPVLFHFSRFTEATQHNPYSSAGRAS